MMACSRVLPVLFCCAARLHSAATHRAEAGEVAAPLRDAFFRLDRDRSGSVDTTELSYGILSAAEQQDQQPYVAGIPPVLTPHPFGAAQCRDPTLDAMSFVECAVHRSRVAAASGGPVVTVGFDAAFSRYVAGCATPTAAWRGGDCLASCSTCATLEGAAAAAAEPSGAPAATDGDGRQPFQTTSILVSSDWHVEPWYLSNVNNHCGAVCRYANATISNMFHCQDGSGHVGPCLLDGQGMHEGKDPPIELEESHLASPPAMEAKVHFFVGDTQAHSFTGKTFSTPAAITKLMGRVLYEEVNHFGTPDNIVWCMGNNDGPHNAIFAAPSDKSTQAWAQQLLRYRIVTDKLSIFYDTHVGPAPAPVPAKLVNATTLFRQTGFYCKALPALGASAYAIVLNTNLGGANPLQLRALRTTLAWIWGHHASKASVYVLGHHPPVMSSGTGICDTMLPPAGGAEAVACRQMVKGVFAGHWHIASATTPALFTQVPAISQYGTTTGFFVGSVSPAAPEFKVTLSQHLVTYMDQKGNLPDKTKWMTANGRTRQSSTN